MIGARHMLGRARRDGRRVRHRDDDRLLCPQTACSRAAMITAGRRADAALAAPAHRRAARRRTANSSTIRLQTVDAIASGCQHAQAGAIERVYPHASRRRRQGCVPHLRRRARALAPRLIIPFELHDNLVLEGLYCISRTLRRGLIPDQSSRLGFRTRSR